MSSTPTPRQLHLNAFLRNIGQHEAAWRLPVTDLSGLTDIDHYINLALIAERGNLDAVFFADHPVFRAASVNRPWDALDPTTLQAALATATSRVGLVATASTTYNDPYNLARRFATLDWVSKGRAAWNVVTTAATEAAANFSFNFHPEHQDRYRRAEEFLEVALGLWDSWEPDAILGDKGSGTFLDPAKVHAINHEGEFFNVAGPLDVPRTPQGRPVIFQAGSSEPGKDLAARYADAIFTAQPTLAEGLDFYNDIKARVARAGRNPEQVLILPGLAPIVAATEKEALALKEDLEEAMITEYGLANLQRILGITIAPDQLDELVPLPEAPPAGQGLSHRSRYALIVKMVNDDRLTARQLLRRLSGGRGHRMIAGDPEQVADSIIEWFQAGAADGFNLIPPALPTSLEAFVDLVVPVLQERGVFRAEYEGNTLREHLGLPQPEVGEWWPAKTSQAS